MSGLGRKRPPTSAPSGTGSAKRGRGSGGSNIAIGASRNLNAAIKADPDAAPARNADASPAGRAEDLKNEFIDLFKNAMFQCTNSALKKHFGNERYLELVPIINELMQSSRLTMSKIGNDLVYALVSEDLASKFSGLDANAKLVYQVIERVGNVGIWTKDIRTQTNIQQQTITKIFKQLEGRLLIKPVKSVNAKAKKIYMVYGLQPAKEVTGGPWYTELEFDHEFINEIRNFILLCVQRINKGKGVTLDEITEKMKQGKVSRIELNPEEVQQLLQTLAYDYKVEQSGMDRNGNALFIPARRVTPMCDFKWWQVLAPDFHFRDIRFEDGVVLRAHEPHYHTA
jgi:DNA-directed RNA polymerase III subunit RPC6